MTPSEPRFAPWPLAACAAVCLLAGCEDLDEFSTDGEGVFRGKVVGEASDSDAPSFIRRGFDARTRLELEFDPALAAGDASPPDSDEPAPQAGTLSAYVCPDDADACAEDERMTGPLDGVALRPIRSLNHDALSQYDFPGPGRIRNYILGTHFVGGDGASATARHAMVFVSLMQNKSIEVRVIAPAALDLDGEELQPALFGVFELEKTSP